ncbi:hypothetical protein [Nocardiopsis sp. YSL2]|uniref:hypothetical protein n=1 Tax=Nocardiopsis sp. YSL2 TaxID=2939492 RepID=UPI0026F46E2A|nr:hypothetical protein [Nocardiopsis sp. YSL2]
MGAPSLEFELGREVTRVAAKLRDVDAKLPTKLRSKLRKAAGVGVKRVKGEVRRMPVSGRHGSTGLRRRVARGVRARASTKSGMRIVTSMPESAESIIPRGLDSRTRHADGGWRHPVFAPKGTPRTEWTWVDQKGGDWFVRPLSEMQPQVTAEIRKVLDEAAAEVASAGA